MKNKSEKILIGVRFAEDVRKEIEAMSKKLGLSQSATVVFLTHFAIEEIKKGNRTVISETIFESDIE